MAVWVSVQPPFPYFTDTDGSALEDGYIWLGEANKNPQVYPLAVYLDDAFTQPVAQPIRTRSGYPAINGAIVRLYTQENYSIQVNNKNGSLIYSAPTPTEVYGVVSENAKDMPYDPPGAKAVQTNVQDKLRETVSVKDFGAVGDGITDDYDSIKNAFDYCVESRKNLYFPSGVYNVVEKNFPFKQEAVPVASLRDCNNVMVFGDGPATVLKTTSTIGADVLQINGVKNLHFHNFKITATLTAFLDAGSNGISITNGFENLSFDNIWVEDCPYVEYPSYLDGGKAFTVQPGTPTVECGVVRATALYVKNCVYGVDVSWDLLNAAQKKPAIMVDAQIEKCYVGVIFGDAGGVLTGLDQNFSLSFMVRAQTINCQKDAVCNRGFGVDWNINVVANESISNLRKNASGTTWNSFDTQVSSLTAVFAKNSQFFVHGYKPSQDVKFSVGATSSTGVTGNTDNCRFLVDVGGTAVTPISSVTFGGNYTDNCILQITPATCENNPSNIPQILYFPTLKNTIVYAADHHFTGLQVTGALEFSYDNGLQTFNSIERDGEALYLKQEVGSSGPLIVFGAKSNTDAKLFGVRNDGYLALASVATASSVSTVVKVLPVYDLNDNLWGFVPVYQTYS